jgi:filamentous hemagglutinin family protein
MKTHGFLFLISILISVINEEMASAQNYQPSNRVPIADTTLGTQVKGNGDFSITGGISRGQNTFHSFQDFSVPTNGSANFVNPIGNQSIITRVTGSLFSDINGTINTQGANFLLINPNGVVFGPGTQLNVGRVFAASTANGIELADGTGRTLTFGVNGSGDGALLSIDPKVIFNVSRLNLGSGSGEIKNFGTLQTNNSSQYIGLVGGNVTLDTGKINAPGGRIELGGLSAPGSVEVATEGESPRLSFPVGVDRSNLALNNQARVNVAGAGAGDIAVNASNIDLLGDSVIRAGLEQNLGTKNAIAGDIKLNATGQIVVDNSGVANSVRNNSQGRAGNINIEANTLSLQRQGAIEAYVSGQGDAGNVQLKVTGAIDIADKLSGVNSLVTKPATGNAGSIAIEAGSLSLKNGAGILSVTTGKGNSGNTLITTKGSVSLVGGDISTNTEGLGKAGNVNINADSISLQNGATVSASSSGQGNAGNVSLIAKGAVSLTDKNTRISASIEVGGIGKGGNIDINAGSLSLLNGAQLLSSSSGQGDAGNVSILTRNAVDFAGKDTGVFTTVDTGKIGSSGDIDIQSATLSITNGAQLLVSNSGKGNAGNVNVRATETVNIAGQEGDLISGIRSDLEKDAEGKAGNIGIDTGLFFLKDGAQLQSATLGKGNAGNVTVNAKGAVVLNNKSAIFSTIETGGIGKAGNIDINGASLSITDAAQVLASSNGNGDAGNISLQVTDRVFLSGFGSQLKSFVGSGTTGNAGSINVKTGSVLLQNDAAIVTANVGQGNAGNITLITKNAQLIGEKTAIISSIESGAIGKGGDINIQAISLSLTDGSLLLAFNNGTGDSGNVNVKVTGAVDIVGIPKSPGGGISNSIKTQGNGGSIVVEADSVSVRNGAGFLATNFGQGNAGTINIKAADSIFFSGVKGNSLRGLFVTALSKNGVAGNIIVAAPQITVDSEFYINAESISGNGGNIFIGYSPVAKSTGSQNIISTPTTNLFFLRNGSTISTNALGVNQQSSDGGNINFNSNLIVAVPKENSDITANAIKGRGGNVNITTQGIIGTQFQPRQTSNSDITASSDFGQSGSISINTPGIDPGKDTSKLPTRPIDASKQISQKCSATPGDNQFYVTGRGGHPPTANELLSDSVVWLDPRNPSTQSIAKNPSTPIAQKSPQPAVGWSFNSQGKVTLLATSNEGKVIKSSSTCPNTVTH